MTRLEDILEFAESHRVGLAIAALLLIAVIAVVDWHLADVSIGYLYLIPILLGAAALNRWQIVALALLCGYLREAFEPLQGTTNAHGQRLLAAFNPAMWVPGSMGRLIVVTAGFVMTGFFVVEINRRRRMLAEHLVERERQMRLRMEAEQRVRILIETSPLAVLILDGTGRVVLENASARQLLGFDRESLSGEFVEPYLPILARMLHRHRGGNQIRTSVECRGQRRNREVFLAHVWLSTYQSATGPGLAAVVWDASENLRDREGAGLDSMMATSRVLIGALSHEVRNLASAAAAAYGALTPPSNGEGGEPYQALGALIRGLGKIASSGLRISASREVATADLDTVLDEARIVIEPMLREEGIELLWETRPGLPLVQADHHSLLQVFVNLTRNSVRALEGRPVRTVHVSVSTESDLVMVKFRDSGPGVANPEELFRPFQPGAQSLGLGLYVARAILRSYGGGLRYEPAPEGACFVVELWPVENAVEES